MLIVLGKYLQLKYCFFARSQIFFPPEGVPRSGVAPVEVGQQELPVAPGPHARPDDAIVGDVALQPVAIGPGIVMQMEIDLWVHCTRDAYLEGGEPEEDRDLLHLGSLRRSTCR